ncbi:MAG: Holliday junction branch migration protein RuvA [Victivallales bacterium]|nr:Holliday junction branch migration protein RuvA [Victivallales bacterium]
MIARLTGILVEAEPTEIIVDVQGVGYSVSVPLSTFDKLPPVGQQVTIHTHFHLREDCMQLFGFATKEERALFRMLMDNVQGVGPKVALNVLSCVSLDSFVTSVANGDVKALSRINGVGKRTAERMVVELKDKIDAIGKGVIGSAVAASGNAVKPGIAQEALDAIAALESLGYKRDAAEKAVRSAAEKEEGASTEQLLRKALAILNS